MPKRNWLITAGFFVLIAAHTSSSHADEARAQAIIDGILGKGSATLEAMDVNPDGRIDVADVVRAALTTETPLSFAGHRWLVGARFYQVGAPPAEGLGVQNQAPVNLDFALDVSATPITVTVADFTSASPANNLLWKALPQDGKTYALNQVMPVGLVFAYAEQGGVVVLDSPRVAVAAALNPTGQPLWRQWTLRLDPQRLARGEFDAGEITERLGGYLPGEQTVTAQGVVSLTPVDEP